jgi:hypothetical protein
MHSWLPRKGCDRAWNAACLFVFLWLAAMLVEPTQVHFDLPNLESGGTFEAKARLKGLCGLLGPESDKTSATLILYVAPDAGSLTGTALQKGNTLEELEVSAGQYVCQLELRPIVHRFKRPREVEE